MRKKQTNAWFKGKCWRNRKIREKLHQRAKRRNSQTTRKRPDGTTKVDVYYSSGVWVLYLRVMRRGRAAAFACLLKRTCHRWLCLMLLVANTSLPAGGVFGSQTVQKAIKVPGRSWWAHVLQAFTVFNTHSAGRGALWKHKLTAQLCSFNSAFFVMFEVSFFLFFLCEAAAVAHSTGQLINECKIRMTSLFCAFTPQCCRRRER